MGPSMVCDVFVCRMYKAAGVFKGLFGLEDSDYQCGEMMNNDMYAMKGMFNAKPARPEACVKNDPKNALCQLTGNYTLTLQLDKFTAHKGMYQTCPTEAPKYERPANC